MLAQSQRDASLRAVVGLSQRKASAVAGISTRSLMRYLSGERVPPAHIGARLIDLGQQARADAAPYLRARAHAQQVPYVDRRDIPLSVQRYERPRVVDGAPEPSRVIVVDVAGMSNAQVASVLVDYWHRLGETNDAWDLRLQANVEKINYFGEKPEDIQDSSLRKYVARKSSVELWLPPQRFLFTRPRSRSGVRYMRYPSASAMLSALNDSMYHQKHGDYRHRLPADFSFSKIAFIPTSAPSRVKRYQKRKGKR